MRRAEKWCTICHLSQLPSWTLDYTTIVISGTVKHLWPLINLSINVPYTFTKSFPVTARDKFNEFCCNRLLLYSEHYWLVYLYMCYRMKYCLLNLRFGRSMSSWNIEFVGAFGLCYFCVDWVLGFTWWLYSICHRFDLDTSDTSLYIYTSLTLFLPSRAKLALLRAYNCVGLVYLHPCIRSS